MAVAKTEDEVDLYGPAASLVQSFVQQVADLVRDFRNASEWHSNRQAPVICAKGHINPLGRFDVDLYYRIIDRRANDCEQEGIDYQVHCGVCPTCQADPTIGPACYVGWHSYAKTKG